MAKKIKLEYEPVMDAERDNVKLSVSPDMVELFKRVALIESATVQEHYNGDERSAYERYKIKRFIADNYTELYRVFFMKDLLKTGQAILRMNYRDFIALVRELKTPQFQAFINDVANYGQKSFEIDVE